MKEVFVETKIDHLKPNMKTLDYVEDIPIHSIIQAKADGEFEFLSFNRFGFSFMEHQAYTLNKWGRLRYDFPALNQFTEAITHSPFQSMDLLCELFAMENGRPLILPQFIHYIKGDPPQLDKIHIGLFDIISINEQPCTDPYQTKFETLTKWLQNCTLVKVLPYMKADTQQDTHGFWKVYVHDLHYEGLVIRTALDTFKCKPAKDLDAVIIGINKKSGYGKGNLFAQNMVTTLKLALMREDGLFVEIGDCASGIDHQLRRSLWKLMDYKVDEDDKTVYVKPFIVITVEYTDLFRGKNKIYKFTGTGYQETYPYTMNLIRFKSPRLIRFRPDKKATPQDLRIQQIPQEYLEDEALAQQPSATAKTMP